MKNNRKPIIRIVVLAGLLFAVIVLSSAFTQSGSSETISEVDSHMLAQMTGHNEATGSFDAFGPVVRMVAALIVVIICIYVGLFVLRKMMGKRHNAIGESGAIQVLQTAYLAPRRSVSLIKVANRAVLVGVTDNQLSVLTELSEEETAELEHSEESSTEPEPFGRFFGRAMQKVRELRPRSQTAVTSTQ